MEKRKGHKSPMQLPINEGGEPKKENVRTNNKEIKILNKR